MDIFPKLKEFDYEELLFCNLNSAGLRAIIAIHDTTLGPALGGCRIWDYGTEEEAVEDALRLARAMTYKASVAGLNFGGGKTVIMGDPKKIKTEELLRALGRYVETLKGRYITAEDVGTSVRDMEVIRQETRHVVGLSTASGGGGDPSPVTAFGIYHGMKACLKEVFGTNSFTEKTVAIQGIGNVGYNLAKLLHKAEVNLIVTDIESERVEKAAKSFGARAVLPDEIYDQECDIFAPCAMGAIMNDETIPRLKCPIVAGSANNQLKEEKHGEMLYKRGIVYAPDFVINAGGLINVVDELKGYNNARALRKASNIHDVVSRVLSIAKNEKVSTNTAALEMAEERIARLKELKKLYMPED